VIALGGEHLGNQHDVLPFLIMERLRLRAEESKSVEGFVFAKA
jgi:hypothetical protein